MAEVLSHFDELRSQQRTERLERMQRFLARFAQIEPPPDFNTFSLLGVATDEVVHTRFLAWLLDHRADHGQGRVFVRAFLELCGLPLREDSLSHYHLRPEFSGLESIIDIMICRPGDFLVYVENKVLSAEGPHQAERESRDMRRTGSAMGVPEGRQIPVFLTPEGRAPTTGSTAAWKPVSYAQLACCLREVLPNIGDRRIRFIIEDWIETVTDWR